MHRRHLLAVAGLFFPNIVFADSVTEKRHRPYDACSAISDTLCLPIQFHGEVPTPQDSERIIAFGRALARGSNTIVRIEGPGAGERILPNAIPTLSQMRAEKIARLLEAGGLPWDRIERISASHWRVLSP